VLQSSEPRPAPVQLGTGKSLVIVIGVNQHSHAQRVEHFGPRHIYISAGGLLEIEGNEIQIVVGVQNVTVEFNIAFDLQMLPCVKLGP
jgi:hypothetical protein